MRWKPGFIDFALIAMALLGGAMTIATEGFGRVICLLLSLLAAFRVGLSVGQSGHH